MSIKLRDLITKVRNCKTAAEERAVVAKECALIRTSFKDSNIALSNYYRPRNVLKLIFIHLRAVNNNNKYPPVAHFGQLESIKLLAQDYFYHKRAGYLALTVLMGNDRSLLTLVTNSLSLDLQKCLTKGKYNDSKYGESDLCAILALNCIANICDKEMVLNLAQNTFRVLGSKRTFLVNKALLCVKKIIYYDPDLIFEYVDEIIKLITQNKADSSSASILCNSVTVLNEMIILSKDQNRIANYLFEGVFQECHTLLDKLINCSFGQSNQGVFEPFLQSKILIFFGTLGVHFNITNLITNSFLTLVKELPQGSSMATAIKYDCIKCILNLISNKSTLTSSEETLDNLAISTLLEFLNPSKETKQKSKNNLILIALKNIDKLLKVKHIRYRNAFKSSLQELTSFLFHSDSSLAKASVDIMFTLLSEDTVVPFSQKLVNYCILPTTSTAHKSYICTELSRFFKFKLSSKNRTSNDVMYTVSKLLYHADKFLPDFTFKYFANLCLAAPDTILEDFVCFAFLFVIHVATSGEFDQYVNLVQSCLLVVGIKGEKLLPHLNSKVSVVSLMDAISRRHQKLVKLSFDTQQTLTSELILQSILKILLNEGTSARIQSLCLSTLPKIATLDQNLAPRIESVFIAFARISETEVQSRGKQFAYLASKGSLDIIPSLSKVKVEDFAFDVIVEQTDAEPSYGLLMENQDDEDLLNIDNILETEQKHEIPAKKSLTAETLSNDMFSGENLLALEEEPPTIDPFATLESSLT